MSIFSVILPRHDDIIPLIKSKLESGEELVASSFGLCGIRGFMPGLLVATNKRVIRYTKRIVGEEMLSCPYDSINLIEETSNLQGKRVTIHFPKGFITFRPSANKDNVERTKKLLSEIYSRADSNKEKSKPMSGANPKDATSLLEELLSMKQRKLITEAEYEEKRKEILARM